MLIYLPFSQEMFHPTLFPLIWWGETFENVYVTTMDTTGRAFHISVLGYDLPVPYQHYLHGL